MVVGMTPRPGWSRATGAQDRDQDGTRGSRWPGRERRGDRTTSGPHPRRTGCDHGSEPSRLAIASFSGVGIQLTARDVRGPDVWMEMSRRCERRASSSAIDSASILVARRRVATGRRQAHVIRSGSDWSRPTKLVGRYAAHGGRWRDRPSRARNAGIGRVSSGPARVRGEHDDPQLGSAPSSALGTVRRLPSSVHDRQIRVARRPYRAVAASWSCPTPLDVQAVEREHQSGERAMVVDDGPAARGGGPPFVRP